MIPMGLEKVCMPRREALFKLLLPIQIQWQFLKKGIKKDTKWWRCIFQELQVLWRRGITSSQSWHSTTMITSQAHRTPYLITEGEQMSSFIKRMPSSEETIQHRISELLEPEMKKFCLQKVVRSLPCYIWFTLSWSWFKLKKRTAHVFIYLHNGCHVPTTVTVVGCTEHCHHILILHSIPPKTRYQFTLNW